MLKITTADHKTVDAPFELRQMSSFIEETLLKQSEEEGDEAITLHEVNERELLLILDYCKYHKYQKKETDLEKKPLKSRDLTVFIKDKYEQDLMKGLDIDQTAALLYASSQLGVAALFELCCACTAAYFKGKDCKTLKEEFELGDDLDYTPENEKQLREDFGWIFDAAEKKIKSISDQIQAKME